MFSDKVATNNESLSQTFRGLISDAARTQRETTEQVRNQAAYFMVAAVAVAIVTSWLLAMSLIMPIN